MQVTDPQTIEQFTTHFDGYQDGLIVFCAQGQTALEMMVFLSGEETLYEISVKKTPDGDTREFTEVGSLLAARADELNHVLAERFYFSRVKKAHAKFAELIVQHNHF